MTEPVVAVDAVTKWYGSLVAVNDVSFDVRPGITGLLGPNGAGKTTLLKLISGLAAPSQGRVSVLGGDPRHNR
ncbi:MAG TPA: ATP-binding cassette domain-containing protein, partial [Gaiellaceae bacterium]|nr:ATP-binding cassette domain-containing protein [Gaiellaceae bacterium]